MTELELDVDVVVSSVVCELEVMDEICELEVCLAEEDVVETGVLDVDDVLEAEDEDDVVVVVEVSEEEDVLVADDEELVDESPIVAEISTPDTIPETMPSRRPLRTCNCSSCPLTSNKLAWATAATTASASTVRS